MQKIKRSEKGFTLVEVVIVVALIALLSAIIFPVFASVRQKGRDTVCLSNLYQIGLATRLYSDDYEGHYPYAVNVVLSEEAVGFPIFKDVIYPYLKNKDVYHCPTDVDRKIEGADHLPTNYFKSYGISYSYDGFLIERSENQSYKSILLANPSKAELCRDYGTWHGMVLGSGYDNYRNVVYLDLHVKRRRLQQLIDESTELEKLSN